MDGNTLKKTDRGGGSRRGFMKAGGAAALGLASSRLLYAGAAPKKVRIGVVGGGFGCSFQWHEHPDCEVAAVSDLRPERRERLVNTYGCGKTYDSLEELVKDPNIDAVAVFTDGPLHTQHAIQAMRHGKHAISAVPAFWGSMEEGEELLDAVKTHGLTYMMAETSYYQQHTISARKFYEDGEFGSLYYCESEYQHDGLESLYWENGKRTWRYGIPPMFYPTHCTAHLVGVTGELLTEVVCHGWGDDSPVLKDNSADNPFWNQSAMFKTDRGNAFRVNIWWKGAHRGCERAQWIGDKMSFYCAHPNGVGPVIVRSGDQQETDDAGFVRNKPRFEPFDQPEWWKTDMLPEPLRHDSGHHGSHTFLTHEFVDAVAKGRRPTVDIYEAMNYTAPGAIAHQSSLQGGALLPVPVFRRPA